MLFKMANPRWPSNGLEKLTFYQEFSASKNDLNLLVAVNLDFDSCLHLLLGF